MSVWHPPLFENVSVYFFAAAPPRGVGPCQVIQIDTYTPFICLVFEQCSLSTERESFSFAKCKKLKCALGLFVLKGTDRPDQIDPRVVPLDRPELKHSLLF